MNSSLFTFSFAQQNFFFFFKRDLGELCIFKEADLKQALVRKVKGDFPVEKG